MRKRNYYGLFLALFAMLFTYNISNAEIKLPAIFGDNMVLQQQTNAAIWGTALPDETVNVATSWNGENYSAHSDRSGKWSLNVETPVAGGPYSIIISDGNAIELKNVLIGEVWICSGQSNMEMTMNGFPGQPVLESNKSIAESKNENIRLFTVRKDKSLKAKSDFKGEWKSCDPENVAYFSAVAYFYGEMLQQIEEVPVGLICSSYGGTKIQPWISSEGCEKLEDIEWPVEPDKDFSVQTPTVLYNAMIAPMAGYGMKGVIWYQGESNRFESDIYSSLMTGLINNWRDEWGIGDFPFYYVQIAPYDYKENVNAAFLREAQLKASTSLPNIGMVCTLDVGEKDCIHPSNKKVVGERLAYMALAKTYGKKGIACNGPVLDKMSVEGRFVHLTFKNAYMGLTTYGKELKNFKIAGENKKFYTANASITRNDGILLFSSEVLKPVAVRYAFDDFLSGELYNTRGIPASSFRTDDWER